MLPGVFFLIVWLLHVVLVVAVRLPIQGTQKVVSFSLIVIGVASWFHVGKVGSYVIMTNTHEKIGKLEHLVEMSVMALVDLRIFAFTCSCAYQLRSCHLLIC